MPKRLPVFLNEEEEKQLLDVFNVRYISSQRNKEICLLIFKTGLRISELVNLQWKDVDLLAGRITVINGKGNKDRILFVSEETLSSLLAWKERQAKTWGKSSYVFSNRKCSKLVARDVREMITNYAKKAEITKHVSPHVLRHTFATNLLRKSKNIRLVQKALGHADLSTTMIYTHIVDEDYEQAMKAL